MLNKEITEFDEMSSESNFLEQFYDKYYKYVYKLAWKECYRSDDVEDVVQSAWELLCAKRDTLQSLSVCKQISYISVTVTNVIRMDARKKKLLVCSLDCISGIGYDGTLVLEQSMDRKIQIEKFREIWPKVDPAVRELLERKYVLEQTDAEIAASMQIKHNSVRTYLTRARRAALVTMQQYMK